MQTADWKLLPDEVQLVLSREAMRRAADTLAEHNRNVQRWQVEYFRQRRQAARTPR